VAQPPGGGQWSDDRKWWWDGQAWVPASQAPTPPPPTGPPGPPVATAVVQRKGHLGRNLAIGCGGLIALAIIIVIAASAASPKQSVPAAPDKATASPTTTKATPTPARQPQTLLDLSGSGSKTTQKFTAARDWDLTWSYDCSNFGSQGNFEVFVYNGDGTLSFQNAPINQLGAKGNDVEHYHTGGTFYLVMNSECGWHVIATG